MTTKEVCKELELSPQRVQSWAKAHGVKKKGRDYDFTEKHIAGIEADKGAGRPKKNV